MTQHKLTTYEIKTREGTREPVRGYVAGEWGVRKERYCYEYTHLPSGMRSTALSVLGIERKADALSLLDSLATRGVEGVPAERRRSLELELWALANPEAAAANARRVICGH